MKYEGFVGPSFSHRNFSYACQTTKNWLIEQGIPVGKGAAPLLFVPRRGLKLIRDDFIGICRGFYVSSTNIMYVVFGSNLHSYDGVVWKLISSSIFGTTEVKFSDNGTHLFFIADNVPYFMTFSTDIITEATGGAYDKSTSLAFLDSYILFSKQNSNQFYWTDLASTTANALNFASAESSPDKIVALTSHNMEIYVFGEKTTEIWYNAGQADITFARRGNAVIEAGCLAPDTIAKIGPTLMWLSSQNRGGIQVSMLNGYQAQRVSTYPIEQFLNSAPIETLKQASAFSQQVDGHDLYILKIAGLNETLVFDLTSSSWTTFTSSQNGVIGQYHAKGSAFFNGIHYTGDSNGTLYQLDLNQYTDNGDFIQFERAAPCISSENKRIFFDQIRFDFFTGANTTAVQVMVDWSDDGGANWSNEILQEYQPGDFSGYIELRRLGYGRNRVFRIRVTNNSYLSLSSASLDIRIAQH